MPAFPNSSSKAGSKTHSAHSVDDNLQAHPLLMAESQEPEQMGEFVIGDSPVAGFYTRFAKGGEKDETAR